MSCFTLETRRSSRSQYHLGKVAGRTRKTTADEQYSRYPTYRLHFNRKEEPASIYPVPERTPPLRKTNRVHGPRKILSNTNLPPKSAFFFTCKACNTSTTIPAHADHRPCANKFCARLSIRDFRLRHTSRSMITHGIGDGDWRRARGVAKAWHGIIHV